MTEIKLNERFDLQKTAESGQVFRWKRCGALSYQITAFGRSVIATGSPDGTKLTLDCDVEEAEKIWKPYFDLDTIMRIFTDMSYDPITLVSSVSV